MKKVLVTGATGNLGPVLIGQLQEKGYQCRALVVPDDPLVKRIKPLKPEIVEGDLASFDALKAAVKEIDYVIHMGCIQRHLSEKDDPAYYFDVNYRGTFLLLLAVTEVAPKLTRFVYTSSCASYSSDNPKYLPIDEDHVQRPYDFYGLSKVCNEATVRCYMGRYNVPCSIARLTTIMSGKAMLDFNRPHRIVNAMKREGRTPGTSMYDELKGLEKPWEPVGRAIAEIEKSSADKGINVIPIDPHGSPWMWHITDPRDSADGLISVMEHPAALGDTFNIMGPVVTWYETAKYLEEKTGTPCVSLDVPCSWRFAMDTSKAARVLGWTHKYGYKRMIDDAVE